ncbi:hypothetical protein PF008_g30052 [Phytophthora fragariae]|uniref:RxLR effector protein n=1 Tax=Phytophthora fragariae TaxID=53985 RepID=A0A6G0Q6M6_9STRA|nr:hypothetical protein PF008_g30052 [Phytophthora fragariae]
MRVQCVAVVAAAAALAASIDGLQIVSNSAKFTSLRGSAEARYPPYIEGKGDRFLISESSKETMIQTHTGFEFSTLQEEDDVLQLNDDEYEDESDSGSLTSDELRIEELGFVENRALRKTASTKLPLFGLVLLKYASNELGARKIASCSFL